MYRFLLFFLFLNLRCRFFPSFSRRCASFRSLCPTWTSFCFVRPSSADPIPRRFLPLFRSSQRRRSRVQLERSLHFSLLLHARNAPKSSEKPRAASRRSSVSSSSSPATFPRVRGSFGAEFRRKGAGAALGPSLPIANPHPLGHPEHRQAPQRAALRPLHRSLLRAFLRAI